MARPSASRHLTSWLVLTGALGAAVIGLAIWAIVLQRDENDASAREAELEEENAALQEQSSELERENSELQERVPGLE